MSIDATDSDAPKFPERFLRYATREFGQEGEAWLEELPSILRRCCDKWGLALGRPTEEIKANYIAYVEMGNGAEAVLKVGVTHDDFSSEMEALAIYEGRGINRLIDCDKVLNAMLLERLRPGKMLDSVENARAQSEITARILQDLHATPPPSNHTLPHFMDWMQGAFADARSCKDSERARGYIEQIPRVQSMMEVLMEPDEPQMLLHGDLHHWNILSDADRGWMAIDPKGVIGASCLDVGRFINNAMGFGETAAQKREILLEAVTIFSDVLGENEERMFAGAFCDKIMGSSWGLQQKPDEHEASSQEALKVMVEVARDMDDRRLRCRASAEKTR